MKIAIAGKMCSGKSTISNKICVLDERYKKYSFATKIKELAVELFNMNSKDRDLLISIGNKFRDIDPDVWVNYVIKQSKSYNYCVIDDVRYQNEVDILLQNGWVIIKLDVNKDDQINRIHKLYPNNYKTHINNLDHFTEQNDLNYKPILNINTSTMDINKINHELYLLLKKNNIYKTS